MTCYTATAPDVPPGAPEARDPAIAYFGAFRASAR